MTDPYRPTYYAPPHQDSYRPTDYAPQSALQLSQSRHTPPHSPYGPPAIYHPAPSSTTERRISRRSHSSDPRYSDRDDRRSRREEGHREEGGRERGDRHRRDSSSDRKSGHFREKSAGATLAGAVGGGYLGHEMGGGALGTIGGLVAGAWGARELERRHERHKRERSATGGERPGSSHGKKGGIEGMIEGAQRKVEGFLNPESARGEGRERERGEGRERRRHRHGGDERRGTRSLSRGRYESDSEEEEYYERRRR